jgi:hypothetical protein
LNEQFKDQLATKYCSGSTDPWCGCYTATLPPEWENDAIKKAIFRCLDSKCEGGSNPNALKPFNLTCPTSYVDCQQKDIQLKMIESGIDKAIVENNCGNVNVGGTPIGTPTGSPTTTPPKSGLSSNTRNAIIGGGVLLMILIMIVIVVLMSSKK